MSQDKRLVDQHVSHLLSRCSTSDERRSLGLEIAKLYADIQEYRVAKRYLERFSSSSEDGSASLLLGRVNELLGDHNGALQAYKNALLFGALPLAQLPHVCQLALDNLVCVEDLKFWTDCASSRIPDELVTEELHRKLSPSRDINPTDNSLMLLRKQLLVDPSSDQLCTQYIKTNIKLGTLDDCMRHCLKCVNCGYHYESPTWFNSLLELTRMVDVSTSPCPMVIVLSTFGRMMLVRLTASTSCLTDFRENLERLFECTRILSTDPEASCIVKMSCSWLFFYTGVYAQRLLSLGGNVDGTVIHHFYQQSTNCISVRRPDMSQFSTLFWDRLELFSLEHHIQALWLERRYPSAMASTLPFSWSVLMDGLQSNQILSAADFERSDLASHSCVVDRQSFLTEPSDDLLEASIGLLSKDPCNLSMVLWICAQLNTYGNDSTLSASRTKFILKFVSLPFHNFPFATPPAPLSARDAHFHDSQSVNLCQLDLLIFLLGTLTHIAIRSACTTFRDQLFDVTTVGVGAEWLILPLCLLPASSLPSSIQMQWWSSAISSVTDMKDERMEKAIRSPLLHCGLNQLRLLGFCTKCPGAQQDVFPIPLLFRLAHSLIQLSVVEVSFERRRSIEEWAFGYWRAALQYHNSSKPSVVLTPSRTQLTFSYTGSPIQKTVFRSRSSLFPQNALHALFVGPDCNWWLGTQRPTDSSPIERNWCNSGVRQLLTILQQRFTNNGKFSSTEKQLFRFLLTLLDQENLKFSPKVFHFAGVLLKQCAANSHAITLNGSMSGCEENVCNSVACDPLFDGHRAQLYLKRATGLPEWDYSSNPDLAKDYDEISSVPFTNSLPMCYDRVLRVNANEISGHVGDRIAESATSNFKLLNDSGDLNQRDESLNISQRDIHSEPQLNDLTQIQELVMASFYTSWQTLISGLSSQLADTRAELEKSRQLNEQLSKQLNETSKQLSEAVSTFLPSQPKVEDHFRSLTLATFTSTINSLQSPIRELSQAINDLRRWLPESMAAAATAAVNLQMSTSSVRPIPEDSFTQLYAPNISVAPPQASYFSSRPPMPCRFSLPNRITANYSASVVDPKHFHPPGLFVPNSSSGYSFDGSLSGDHNDYRLAHGGILPQKPDSFHPAVIAVPDTVIPPADKCYASPGTSSKQDIFASTAVSQGIGHITASVDRLTTRDNPSTYPASLLDVNSCAPRGLFPPAASDPFVSVAESGVKTSGNQSSPIFALKTSDITRSSLSSAIPIPSHGGSERSELTSLSIPTTHSADSFDQLPESFEPAVNFKPVLDTLPDIVDQQTGEEGEERVFSNRARLYRYDKATKTWLTRGTGEVRILHDLKQNTRRLVMRRDQVKKLCANHRITPNLKLTLHTKDNRMAMWAVRDYAESSEGKDETFMIQFKSPDILSQFIKVFSECGTEDALGSTSVLAHSLSGDTSLSDGTSTCTSANSTVSLTTSQATTPVDRPVKPTSETADPFMSKFVRQHGSWDCPACLLHNEATVSKCPACNTAKPTPRVSTETPLISSAPTPLFGGFTVSSGGFVFGRSHMTTSSSSQACSTPTKPLFSFVASSQTPSLPSAGSVNSQRGFMDKEQANVSSASDSLTSTFYFGKGSPSTQLSVPTTESDSDSKKGSVFTNLDLTATLRKPSFAGFQFSFGMPSSVAPCSKDAPSATSSNSKEIDVTTTDVKVTEEQISRARELQLPDEFYKFENGHITGVSEALDSAEEAEEDSLLDAAIRRGFRTGPQPDTTHLALKKTEDVVSGLVDADKNLVVTVTSGDVTSTTTALSSLTNTNNQIQVTPNVSRFSTESQSFVLGGSNMPDFSSLSAKLREDNNPSWGNNTLNNINPSDIWSKAGTPLFSKPKNSGETTAEETENFDPHYDPVVSLPELVQVKTGEESELCIFLKSCRVYRFADGAWKDRGVGDMKVLVSPLQFPSGCKPGSRDVVPHDVDIGPIQRARLLMRRHHVLKLCVNQPIGLDVPCFKPLGASGSGVCWIGEDYSEGSASRETLAVRFKTQSENDEFKAAVSRAQAALQTPPAS